MKRIVALIFSLANLNNNQSPSFSLAQLTFNTIGIGNDIPIVLSINDLGDAAGNGIVPSSIVNGSVTVTALPVSPPPVPAQVPLSSGHISVLLLVAGLGVVGAQRKFSIKV